MQTSLSQLTRILTVKSYAGFWTHFSDQLNSSFFFFLIWCLLYKPENGLSTAKSVIHSQCKVISHPHFLKFIYHTNRFHMEGKSVVVRFND